MVVDANGEEAARTASAADGTFALALPPGRYRIVPQPVQGLMGTASALDVAVGIGEDPGELTIAYDTGIR